ncbi:hypothetical protein [Myroides sp. DW712]|uniref:hypothetical protein n=1 Tax=Myroides sp. DW712 TaxID=3389800 RepID=UPI00397B3E73
MGIWCCLPVQAQRAKQQIKVLGQGTTLDSIHITDAKVGALFLEVKSYFEEYSSTQPASVIQLYFQERTKQGDLVVRYVYTHKLLDFHIQTTMTYPDKSKQVFAFDRSRRVPLEVALTLGYRQQQLEVDLL